MENMRAEAATPMAATRADLLRNGDAAGDGFRCPEAALERLGGNRGYLRYRVGVQDTFGPSVGRGEGIAGDATRRVLLVHQAARQPCAKRPKLPKR
jgi:hypothetical protein